MQLSALFSAVDGGKKIKARRPVTAPDKMLESPGSRLCTRWAADEMVKGG